MVESILKDDAYTTLDVTISRDAFVLAIFLPDASKVPEGSIFQIRIEMDITQAVNIHVCEGIFRRVLPNQVVQQIAQGGIWTYPVAVA